MNNHKYKPWQPNRYDKNCLITELEFYEIDGWEHMDDNTKFFSDPNRYNYENGSTLPNNAYLAWKGWL